MIKRHNDWFRGLEKVNKIDYIIVIITVLSLFAVGGFAQPLVIAPLNDIETTDTRILFSIDRAEYVLIDDNMDFTTPDRYEVRDGMKIDLEPGVYYWKAVGVTESEIRTLTINTELNLELQEFGSEYNVLNAGNIPLNVEVYDGEEKVEEVRLEKGEESGIVGSKFIGRISS